MRLLFKTLLGFIVLLFIFVVCVLGLAVWIFPKMAPKVVDSWVEGRTGFSVVMGEVDLRVFVGSLKIDGVTVINPPYYQSANFIQIKQLSLQMEPKSVFYDRVVFDHIFLEIERITCVRNGAGSINVKEFFDRLKKKKNPHLIGENVGVDEVKRQHSLDKGFIIKKLVIRINNIDMVGFLGENEVQNFALNYNEEFVDVTDLEVVIKQIVETMKNRGIVDIADKLIERSGIKEEIKEKIMGKVQKEAERAFRRLKKLIK